MVRLIAGATVQRGVSNTETIDPGKEKNVFESRVTEYRSGANLRWDWAMSAAVMPNARPR